MFMICSDMTAAAALIDALPDAISGDRGRAMTGRQLQILGRLAEAGLEIALALEAQAKGGEAVVQGDVAMAFSRVARAVRQTVMLQSKLSEALNERETARSHRRAAAGASASRIVRDVIEDDGRGDRERTERLTAEAAERLREEDFGDLLSRPFAEAVADIVRDLGLEPDWLALAEACCDAEAALAGRPGEAPEEPSGPIDIRWIGEDDPSDWKQRRLGGHARDSS